MNIITTPAATSATTSVEVTQKNQATVKVPRKAKVKVTAAAAKTLVPATTKSAAPLTDLKSMEQARIKWETTELAAANNRLYFILTQAYSYYLTMKNDVATAVRKAHLASLDDFIKEHGYAFSATSHDMTRVIKCVFGVDRRRVSAYSIALREALRQNIAAANLTQFLELNGGVEQIRLGGTKPLTATQRADKVKAEVSNTELGHFKFDPAVFAGDPDWNDKQVVIVATYLPTGEFQANAVVQHTGAVNAALSAFYAQQNAKVRAEAKADRDAEKENEKYLKQSAAKVRRQIQKNKPAAEKRKAKAKKEEAEKARRTAMDSRLTEFFAAA